jgi:acyl-[acyl-carrier-protein]-phospholipid O-acyltransferase/long-chain-fatty-acid--[acyl-carrier-protein] ligase
MIEFLRWLTGVLWRFRAYNTEGLQTPGPVLLVPNHVSWLDWLFLGVVLETDWKFVVSSVSAETSWLHRQIMLNRRTFPIDTLSPYSARHMAEFLERNGRLVLFAEGRLSQTGSLMKLFEGTGFLLHKTRAKVITCYLRGAHRLPLSPNSDQKQWFPTVTAHFSDVLTAPHLEHVGTNAARARLTTWLQDQMVRQRFETEMEFGPRTVPEGIVQTARRHPGKVAMQDIAQKVSYRRLVLGARLLAEQLGPRLEAPADKNVRAPERVGVLLPNVVAHPMALLALWHLGKVPAELNYSTGSAALLACAQLAGLRQVLTSRAFLARARLDLGPLTQAGLQLIYLEDVRKGIPWHRKIVGALQARFALGGMLATPQTAEDTAVVLFTSGSEGMPKGVELTHRNLLSNLHQALSVIDVQDRDRMFNALPMFHSFGLTVGTLLPLLRGAFTYLYPSPLHYRVVPTVAYFNDCTILLSTNTFLAGYARKAHPMDFRSMRYVMAGAEKLQEQTFDTWARRFGIRVLEGYGLTECSPIVSVNLPMASKQGTGGRLLPGIEYKLEPVAGIAQGGRLLVRGPNVMRGYLNPEADANFKKLGGWYDTGDIASVDAEGFLAILGRLKRFAKISGEMISLTAVEEGLAGAFPQFGSRFQVAVISRPDEVKGEVLVVVTNEPRLQLDTVRAALRERGFPNLAAPREIKVIKELPVLGTGKVNHRELAGMVG